MGNEQELELPGRVVDESLAGLVLRADLEEVIKEGKYDSII